MRFDCETKLLFFFGLFLFQTKKCLKCWKPTSRCESNQFFRAEVNLWLTLESDEPTCWTRNSSSSPRQTESARAGLSLSKRSVRKTPELRADPWRAPAGMGGGGCLLDQRLPLYMTGSLWLPSQWEGGETFPWYLSSNCSARTQTRATRGGENGERFGAAASPHWTCPVS